MISRTNIDFLERLSGSHIHGRNILAKIRRWSTLTATQRKQIAKALSAYLGWHAANLKDFRSEKKFVAARVGALNRYMTLVRGFAFSQQDKFHSTVLEEFVVHLFKGLLEEINQSAAADGETHTLLHEGTRAYSNLFFAPKDLKDFLAHPKVKINEKDQDFSIFRTLDVEVEGEHREINVPIVSIEVKTYLDKTMLEGAIATAEKIKAGNPYCLFLVVVERYDVSFDVDPKHSRIDQIYVLRKEKRPDGSRITPIAADVVFALYEQVKKHLANNWSDVERRLLAEGKVF